MENGSKIKIDSSVKSKKLNVKSYGTERVAGYGLRVASYGLRVTRYELRVAGCGLRVTSLRLRGSSGT